MFSIAEVIWLPIFYGLFTMQFLSGNFISAALMLGIDLGLIALSTLYKGRKLNKTRALLMALPATFLMRFYDSYLWITTSIKYGLLNRRVDTWNIEDKLHKKYKFRKCHACGKFTVVPYSSWDKDVICKNKKCGAMIPVKVAVSEGK